MAEEKILARGWTIEMYGVSSYTAIGGINTFSLSSGKESSTTTDFNSVGNAEHIPAERTKSVTSEGFFKEDDTGTRDAGQELIETLAEAVGPSGIGTLHLASPGGGYEVWLNGSANLSDIGGGNNDPTSWGFEFERTGASLNADPNAA